MSECRAGLTSCQSSYVSTNDLNLQAPAECDIPTPHYSLNGRQCRCPPPCHARITNGRISKWRLDPCCAAQPVCNCASVCIYANAKSAGDTERSRSRAKPPHYTAPPRSTNTLILMPSERARAHTHTQTPTPIETYRTPTPPQKKQRQRQRQRH
jgi:hypothetical protein